MASQLHEADPQTLDAGRQRLVGAGVEFALRGLDAGRERDRVFSVFKRGVLHEAADRRVGLPLMDAEPVAEGLR